MRNIFCPTNTTPFKLSRSKIENFIRCQRCFYLDRKCGVEQPPMFPYTLNNAVDALLKKEFDQFRAAGKAHPYMIEHGINAIPFAHPNFKRSIKFHHEATSFIVYGIVDDVWINQNGELIIVDYKATSTKEEVTLNDRDSYKRQMEVYQWLFRKNGFKVSDTSYFVYCNGDSSRGTFAGALQFKVVLKPYAGNDSWVEKALFDIHACLSQDVLPQSSPACDYCKYFHAVKKHVDE